MLRTYPCQVIGSASYAMHFPSYAIGLASYTMHLPGYAIGHKPMGLWTSGVPVQKFYIHNNPVAPGFVREPDDWKYGSAMDDAGGKGLLEIDYL